jgi:hypothetical protein
VDEIDLLSASLRADAADLGAFAEALARRFEDALPRQTRVRRERRGFLSREKVVREVALDVDGDRYCLRNRAGVVEATRARVSGGIALKSEPLEIPAWIDELTAALAREAQRSGEAQQALQRMLT